MWKLTALNKTWIQDTIFFFTLIGLFFFLGFWDLITYGPHGIHFMRQTDSLSFASQYYNKSFSFFEPRLFNLTNTDGKAACEFPLTYYITAILYAVFGSNLLTLKLLHLIIISLGVYAVFRMSYLLIRDYFYATFVSLFLFNSTVFIYYSFNYLPDSPTLGFTFLGWYFFFKYLDKRKKNTLTAGFFFFLLASLIKVTYLINPLSIMVLALYNCFSDRTDFNKRILVFKALRLGGALLSIVLAWNIYMLYYNGINDSSSFNTSALPIWNLSQSQIRDVWDSMRNYWYTKYFAQSSSHLLFIIVILQFIFIKKSNFILSFLTLILLLGSLSYFILFYSQFRDHDYYFLAFLPLVVLVLINGFKTLKNISLNKYIHLTAKVTLSIIIIAGINYSRMKLKERTKNTSDIFSEISFLILKNKDAIEKLNLPLESKFIVAPDLTPNGGLFFLNRMGWNIEKKEDITIAKIAYLKDLGAEYLLIESNSNFLATNNETVGDLVFKGNGIEIFKLDRNMNIK